MKYNFTVFLVLFTLSTAILLTSCGKKKEIPGLPSSSSSYDSQIDIPEEFETADDIILETDSANDVKKKIEAGAKYGVGMSNTAFSLLQSDVSDWQGRVLNVPGTYTIDKISATGMSLSYIVMEGGYFDSESDCYRVPVGDLKAICTALFGEDYVSDFLKSKSELPGYELTVSSKEVTFVLTGYEPEKTPQYIQGDMTDNGDGTYGASVEYHFFNDTNGEWSDSVADATYTLSETDKNATGYMIVDWTMTVY